MQQGKRISLSERILAAAKYVITGNDAAWFGPGEPVAPIADKPEQQTIGRLMQYPVAMNLQQHPRQNEGNADYATLRQIADAFDLVRMCIETRKDQLCSLDYAFQFKDKQKNREGGAADPRIEELQGFFMSPDKQSDWRTWMRMLVEDLLVIDAPTLYPRGTLGGKLYSLDVVDGASIKRVIDGYGRSPAAPDPAYQQVFHGVPTVNYTIDELIYRPFNLRSWRLYGFSPVEQILLTVNIALRRQAYQLEYFTQGNIPDSIFSVPAEWTPEMVVDFQASWDMRMASGSKKQGLFVPNGVNLIDTKAEAMGKNDQVMNEWLARVVCFAFNVTPTQLTVNNNRAVSDSQKETAQEDGLEPLKLWMKSIIDGVIYKYFGYSDLEFVFVPRDEPDSLKKAQTNQIYLAAKVLDPNEVRADLGLPPLTAEQQERLNPPPPPQLMPLDSGEKPQGDGKEPEKCETEKVRKYRRTSNPYIIVKAEKPRGAAGQYIYNYNPLNIMPHEGHETEAQEGDCVAIHPSHRPAGASPLALVQSLVDTHAVLSNGEICHRRNIALASETPFESWSTMDGGKG
jgi:Phage portal protein